MKLFVIDTAREGIWRQAFPNCILVCATDMRAMPEFKSGDIVLAHTHEEPIAENPDFVLNGVNCGPNVNEFCKELLKSAENHVAPMVVLYSGDCLRPAYVTMWKDAASTAPSPLAGYPLNRIKILQDGVTRDIVPERLSSVLSAIFQRFGLATESSPQNLNEPFFEGSDRLGSQTPATNAPPIGLSVTEGIDQNTEAVLAARLLCEAAEECPNGKPTPFGEVTVHPPDQTLLVAAKAVLYAAETKGEDLNAAVTSLVTELKKASV